MGVKIYKHHRYTQKKMKLRVDGEQMPISFDGGMDRRKDGFWGGIFATDDVKLQEALESHPEFQTGLITLEQETNTKVKKPDIPSGWQELDISNANAASKRMVEMFDDIEYKDVQGKEKLKAVADQYKVRFPNIFDYDQATA